MDDTSIRSEVETYYSAKIEAHGATPLGVDWNSAESQRLRFLQIAKLIDCTHPFTINDFGCGYGALADFLKSEGYSLEYRGFDISPRMIERAKEVHLAMPQVAFVNNERELNAADYTVASGVFNVKLRASVHDWTNYLLRTLQRINDLSIRGFAFNVLTKYSDPEMQRNDLYYADPLFLFDHCKMHFSRFVTLLHDYPLYEFTLLVKKED